MLSKCLLGDGRLAQRTGVLLFEPLLDAALVEHVTRVARQGHHLVVLGVVLKADRALLVAVLSLQVAPLDLTLLEVFQKARNTLVVLSAVDHNQEGHQVGDQRRQATALAHG